MISMGKYYYDIYREFDDSRTGDDIIDYFRANEDYNYQNKLSQQLYQLKNVYLNAFEYKHIFLDLLKDGRGIGSDVKLVSVGCGAMTDYFALQLALNTMGQSNKKITYLGCDKVNWDYKFDPRDSDNVFFCHNDAAVMFQKSAKMSADLYFFPKSIREFDYVRFKSICRAFADREIISDKFSIAIVADDFNNRPWHDEWFVDALIKAVCSNDFMLCDKEHISRRAGFLGRMIYDIDKDFADLKNVYRKIKTRDVARDFEYKILTFSR